MSPPIRLGRWAVISARGGHRCDEAPEPEHFMEAPVHTLSDLFRQLGLHDDTLAASNRGFHPQPWSAAGRLGTARCAGAWSACQARFLREDIQADANWSVAVDALAVHLTAQRSSRSMSPPLFDLYAFWRTSATFRVRVALRLKGIAATEHQVNLDADEQRSRPS